MIAEVESLYPEARLCARTSTLPPNVAHDTSSDDDDDMPELAPLPSDSSDEKESSDEDADEE